MTTTGHAPHHLRVEHLGDAELGIGERRPRLSWQLPDGSAKQQAYQLEIDGIAGEPVDSNESVLVRWPAAQPLSSRQRVHWRVKVWTDFGESPWSAVAWFEAGLLESGDWAARCIEPFETERGPHLLRHRFVVDSTPLTARLYATGHGIYEAFLNGRRVGDIELAPGCTDYTAILQVQTYDVTDLLVAGENTWEVTLTDGWWRGRTGFMQLPDGYGDKLAFLGQLETDRVVAMTGPGWESTRGPIRSADLMLGQVEDHRIIPSDWHPAGVTDRDLSRLCFSPAPPSRRVQELQPVAITQLAVDRQVVDLGQNINGWIRLSNLGPRGTELTLVHGEALDAIGDVTQTNLLGPDYFTGKPLEVGMTDRVVAAGIDREVFEPRHTTHGFQYVRIEGHPEVLAVADVTGVVVHTDMTRTGSFRCSDDRINRLHDICEWSFRGNACEIPTDCPQRERSGWTGDWQVFVQSAAFLYDVAGFSLKWLRDVVAEQLPNGCVTNIAPDPIRWRASSERWLGMQGSSGWGDAIVMVPWELWRSYGDLGMLAELWPAMVAWVDFAAGAARHLRHPSREQARPTPAPHEAYLWDGGYHWGEWLEPGGAGDVSIDQGSVGTAFLHHTARLASQIADLLGRQADAARFDELATNALNAWRTEFIRPDGSLTPDTQATHVRALAFGLVPDDLRAQTADRLVQLIRDADTHLGTGFLATSYLLPVLADTGHLDVAYELLSQDTAPSWLAMVERGATTVWELWEGIDEQGVAHDSLNHYSKGAVISFLHQYVAGIQIIAEQPGYRRFRIAPQPGGGLTSADATHDCPYGRIAVSWQIAGDRFHLEVTVPPGTTADVVLPEGSARDQPPGRTTYDCELP